MNVILRRKWFLGFSGILVAASIVCVVVFGFRAGIDLKGGTRWEFSAAGIENEGVLLVAIKEIASKDVLVNRTGGSNFILRFSDISESEHQEYVIELTKRFGPIDEKQFSSIGPAVGMELRKKSIWAVVAVLFGISLYVAWAFRKVSRPIRSWKYGAVTLVSLFHDVAIPAGMLAVLGRFGGVEIDTNFIVALLVVMGFWVNDKMVVFDRIRENILIMKGKQFALSDVINKSIKETMRRSINTSLTLILVLLALIIFGPQTLFYFVLTILVGTVFGTYSSIFVASPLLYVWERAVSKKSA